MSADKEEGLKTEEIKEISETFQRENEKILELETEISGLKESSSSFETTVAGLEKQVQNLEKKLTKLQNSTQKKMSFVSKLLIVLLFGGLCYGGYWLYEQEDKTQALTEVGDALVEQKNVISTKIDQISQNISNAEIQEQVNTIEKAGMLSENERKILREEILKLQEISEKNSETKALQKQFQIDQLEAEIKFLKSGKIAEISLPIVEKTENIPEEKEDEKIEKIENDEEGESVEEEKEEETETEKKDDIEEKIEEENETSPENNPENSGTEETPAA